MSSKIPSFGVPQSGRRYVKRPGAYALIVRDDRLLMVDENSGWFLPGGGLEEGESFAEALRREMLEETGYRIDAPIELTRVRQYALSQSEHVGWEKDCHIFKARLTSRAGPGDCPLRWARPQEAIDELAHGRFRWVVAEYLL